MASDILPSVKLFLLLAQLFGIFYGLYIFARQKAQLTGKKLVTNMNHYGTSLIVLIGSFDGKHIVIQAPKGGGSMYFNYKHTHRIVLLATCDAKYCFTLLNIGGYGSHSDGGVLRNSAFGKALERGHPPPEPIAGSGSETSMPYVFIGDAAFPLRKNTACQNP